MILVKHGEACKQINDLFYIPAYQEMIRNVLFVTIMIMGWRGS